MHLDSGRWMLHPASVRCSRTVNNGRQPERRQETLVEVDGLRNVDVAVVGGGVVGAAIAARLSATTATVRLFERNDDVGDEASKGNAGITSSYYAEPGSLDAEVIGATYRRWEETSARLDVPFRRIGGLITALNEEEVAQLPPQLEEALGCGARAQIS